ncbi:hypothetical protein [Marivirga lumbricoides]
MKRLILILMINLAVVMKAWAGGESSTYFNIYVPHNNDTVQRNVALTPIHDSTTFVITDDGFEDLIISDNYQQTKSSYFKKQNGSFIYDITPDFLKNGKAICTIWVDPENDTDLFVADDQQANQLYINEGDFYKRHMGKA